MSQPELTRPILAGGSNDSTMMANLAFVWVMVLVSAVVGGCSSRPVGTPRPETEVGLLCALEADSETAPHAASVSEVYVEGDTGNTSLCVAYHFQGRSNCPYGQTLADYDAYVAGNISAGDGRLCRVSGGSAVVAGAVAPQLFERTSARTLYRSCRCANHLGKQDDGAEYCPCPSAYECATLIDDLFPMSSELAGAYCIKSGTKYDPSAPTTPCSRDAKNCGFDGGNP